MSSTVQVAGIFLMIIGIFGTTNCYIPNSADLQILEPRDTTNDYTVFRDIDVSYKVYTERVTWNEASRRCIREDSRLAIIDTTQKIQYVAEITPAEFSDDVWVGIRRAYSTSYNHWKRTSDDSIVRHVPWAPGRPIGGHESYNCLAIASHAHAGLTNEGCWQRRGFVCERSV